MIHTEAETGRDRHGRGVLVPRVETGRLHAPFSEQVHGPGGERLAQIVAPVSGQCACRPQIAPPGV